MDVCIQRARSNSDVCTLIHESMKNQHTCIILRLIVHIYLSLGQSQRYELFPHTQMSSFLFLQPCHFMEFPLHHQAPVLISQCTFFFFSVVLIQPICSAILSTRSQHNHNCTYTPGQELLDQRSWSEKRWEGRAVGQRTHTPQNHADAKPELCKYEIKQPKML